MQKVVLNNGVEMPILGFGVYQVDPNECEEIVYQALQAGYRSIDTAAVYGNEAGVGRAIKRSGIPRNELFITTKLWVQDASYEKAQQAFAKSLANLQLDYVDLYLIHMPFGDVYGAWRAMQELNRAGKIKAIGISNFAPDRVVDLILHNEIPPAVNQIETHPYFQQAVAEATLKEYKVAHESWGPFAQGRANVLNDAVLIQIGKKHGKTSAQVTLRWLIQRGIVVIPKSVHKERIIENFNVFDFQLDADDLQKIAALDRGKSVIWDPTSPQAVKMASGTKVGA
jgi:diketogulonate reductase-like aldo/keto reductase